MSVSIYSLVEAVRSTLAEISGVYTYANETMREGITDLVAIQVYPESGEVAQGSRTERNTFGKGLVLHRIVLHVDVYARQRSEIGLDMAAVARAADAVIAELDAQQTSPPFGLSRVHTWHYTWNRVTFVYGDPEIRYAGIRFVLTFMSE